MSFINLGPIMTPGGFGFGSISGPRTQDPGKTEEPKTDPDKEKPNEPSGENNDRIDQQRGDMPMTW